MCLCPPGPRFQALGVSSLQRGTLEVQCDLFVVQPLAGEGGEMESKHSTSSTPWGDSEVYLTVLCCLVTQLPCSPLPHGSTTHAQFSLRHKATVHSCLVSRPCGSHVLSCEHQWAAGSPGGRLKMNCFHVNRRNSLNDSPQRDGKGCKGIMFTTHDTVVHSSR